MELKLNTVSNRKRVNILLIVPYGIETNTVRIYQIRSNLLLIVPYGIETVRMRIFAPLSPSFNCTLWN